MTAEIAVMNRVAIALAADSAATTIRDDPIKQEKTTKIFNSADKLFQLDAQSPVGVMVYNASSFMGVPWETVIKLYRKYSGGPQNYLKDHANDFLKFLVSKELLSDGHIDDFFIIACRNVLSELLGLIKKDVANSPSKTFADAAQSVAQGVLDQFKQRPLVDGWSDTLVSDLLSKYDPKIEATIASVFGADDPGVTAKGLLKELVARFHIVQPAFNNFTTGLVIAGFGQAELYPSLWTSNIGSVLFNRTLQQSKPDESAMGLSGTDAWVRPFAQGEVALSFLTGIQPDIRQHCTDTFGSLLSKFLTRFLALVTPMVTPAQSQQLQTQLSADINLLTQEFGTDLNNKSQTKHVQPVMAAVGVLPKDQLAVMAESLVALTSFRRRMSSDLETVGGAIDVAVISKGDGFVWIKRKHYFDPGLNLRYTERFKSTHPSTPNAKNP
jgi:hypothetical protein